MLSCPNRTARQTCVDRLLRRLHAAAYERHDKHRSHISNVVKALILNNHSLALMAIEVCSCQKAFDSCTGLMSRIFLLQHVNQKLYIRKQVGDAFCLNAHAMER